MIFMDKKIVLPIILIIVGTGLVTSPMECYVPPTPGHEITFGLFGIMLFDTNYSTAKILFYLGAVLIIIGIVCFILLYIKNKR